MAKNELITPHGDSAMDETNDALKAVLATALAGEDVTNDVTKVEQRFAYSLVTSDTAVKSAPPEQKAREGRVQAQTIMGMGAVWSKSRIFSSLYYALPLQ